MAMNVCTKIGLAIGIAGSVISIVFWLGTLAGLPAWGCLVISIISLSALYPVLRPGPFSPPAKGERGDYPIIITGSSPPACRQAGEGGERAPASGGVRGFSLIAFIMLTIVSLTVIAQIRATPLGSWDAWAFWNTKAEFLTYISTHSGETRTAALQNLFSSDTQWMHPDYPLLVPALVAQFSALPPFLGKEGVGGWWVIPVMVSIAYGAGIILLLLGTLPGKWRWIAIIILCGIPIFPRLIASQYADIEVAYYILAVVALYHPAFGGTDPSPAKRGTEDLPRVYPPRSGGWGPALAGMGGFLALSAAWTKNEGIIFAIIFFIIAAFLHLSAKTVPAGRHGGGLGGEFKTSSTERAGVGFEREQWKGALKRAIAMICGILLPLLAILTLKLGFSSSNELFLKQPADWWLKLIDPERYFITAKHLFNLIFRDQAYLGYMGFALVLLTAYSLWLWRKRHKPEAISHKWEIAPAYILGLTAICYFFVYILTPQDLQWHLDTSADRLIFHLIPAGIFLLSLPAGRQGKKLEDRV